MLLKKKAEGGKWYSCASRYKHVIFTVTVENFRNDSWCNKNSDPGSFPFNTSLHKPRDSWKSSSYFFFSYPSHINREAFMWYQESSITNANVPLHYLLWCMEPELPLNLTGCNLYLHVNSSCQRPKRLKNLLQVTKLIRTLILSFVCN